VLPRHCREIGCPVPMRVHRIKVRFENAGTMTTAKVATNLRPRGTLSWDHPQLTELTTERSKRRRLLQDRLNQTRIVAPQLGHRRLVQRRRRAKPLRLLLLLRLSEPRRRELAEQALDLVVGGESSEWSRRSLSVCDGRLHLRVVAELARERDSDGGRVVGGVFGRFAGRKRAVVWVGRVDDHEGGFASGLNPDFG
jgi:hypothetical protein